MHTPPAPATPAPHIPADAGAAAGVDPQTRIAFIGGGNMASALIGGLLRSGHAASALRVVEPDAAQRERLAQQLGVQAQAAADARLADAALVVWAVKPQLFAQAAAPCVPHVGGALQLSVMAGLRCAALASTLQLAQPRIVRSMPNTPALIGRGIAGLYATPAVRADERARVDALLAPTGQTLWLDDEAQLDAVTAISGSGPAYVFFWAEALIAAGVQMGLSEAHSKRLALATFDGAAALASQSDEPVALLRERVTSKGGTTYAALQSLQADGVDAAVVRAAHAAQRRAQALGDELGGAAGAAADAAAGPAPAA